MLYALRSQDKVGAGWSESKLSFLVRTTGFKEQTVRSHLSKLKKLGWIYDYKTKGGTVWCRYKSHSKLRDELGGHYGVCSKKSLKSEDFLNRATIVHVLIMQMRVEAKAFVAIKKKDNVFLADTNYLRRKARFQQQQRGAKSSTTQNVYVSGMRTFGLNQKSLAKPLGISRFALADRLKSYPKIRVYREANPEEVFSSDDATEVGKHLFKGDAVYRAMPYVYLDNGYTKKAHRKMVQARRARKVLNEIQWETAKLTGITRGHGYSEQGAEKTITDQGLGNFIKWTFPAYQQPENGFKPDMSKYDKFTGEYAERKRAEDERIKAKGPDLAQQAFNQYKRSVTSSGSHSTNDNQP